MKMKKKLYFPVLLTLLASLVFGVFPLGQGVAYASPGWVPPTDFVDSGATWTDEALAYDTLTGNYAFESISGIAWGNYLDLTLGSAIYCDKVQIWSGRDSIKIDQIEVDVYSSDDGIIYNWNNIYLGALVVDSYQEYSIGVPKLVTKMRVRYYESQAGKTYEARLVEAAFWEVPPDITNDSITGNSYDFGTVDAGSTTATGLTYFTVTNNTSFDVNITISGTDMTGGTTWTLSDTATQGEDTYGLKAGLAGDAYNIIVPKTFANPLVSDLAGSGGTQQWGLQLLAPDTFTGGGTNSGTVTLTATAV